jgi:hypothetical protein
VSDLPPEYLDPDTPADVIVTDVAPPRITDPTLGVALGPAGHNVPAVPATPAHRLVTVGDSLTHGVSSGAVFRTDLSWPSLVAEQSGIDDFAVPTYGGPLDGLPVNLETLVRKLEERFGDELGLFEKAASPVVLHGLLDANEDYWERGEGRQPPRTDVRYDNVGIYGWDVRDALSYTAGRAADRVAKPTKDSLLAATPEHDNDIAAGSILAPFGATAAQIDAATAHGLDGGIDTLVIALGANNALDSVISKRVQWSGADFADLDAKGAYNVWRPTHFAVEYGLLVAAVRAIAARRVVLATVPHVTIAPIAKGVNPENPGEKWKEGSRFFPYYTDPWIEEKDFRPSKHRHLTHAQARAVDSAIDQFNAAIIDAVRGARADGRDWYLLDLCGVLDGLAFRRYITDEAAAEHSDWEPYELPAPIADLDTRFFRSDKTGRKQGGLFGLDGIHPTTSGYGVLAQAVLDVLAVAGVPVTNVDFAHVRTRDTLNSQPPALVEAMLHLIAPFATQFVSRA